MLDGGCSCGEVRYRLTSAPMFVNCCHCLDCQRQTGSAFVLNALIETDRVETLCGEPIPVPRDIDGAGEETTRKEIEAALSAVTWQVDEEARR